MKKFQFIWTTSIITVCTGVLSVCCNSITNRIVGEHLCKNFTIILRLITLSDRFIVIVLLLIIMNYFCYSSCFVICTVVDIIYNNSLFKLPTVIVTLIPQGFHPLQRLVFLFVLGPLIFWNNFLLVQLEMIHFFIYLFFIQLSRISLTMSTFLRMFISFERITFIESYQVGQWL